MNEQDISKAVEAVLGQMNGQHAQYYGEGHVCRCNKEQDDLKAGKCSDLKKLSICTGKWVSKCCDCGI